MKKVLIVDDSMDEHKMLERALRGHVFLVQAFSIADAEREFAAHPDVDAIVMDACVPGDKPTTMPLVKRIRQTFSGPMIAASGMLRYRLELMDAGCDHQAEKDDVPMKVLELLGIEV